ncbi:NADH dehydrogenase [ubiquinone] 1 alpha subcomplex subunit 3 [Trachemys scripta elegans]|uniref:NADH dehydrogenase [ubiquinone] 1 alpha subcomplex subunit 3 n=1 Tax=Trachemys scripta elegans TaxID=31138 RepID=UPI0015516688|nr:NADH dehydrogenase [ubiquinone] 1 alpha subcomplex subunit 3 [Trachemys scripta elegans]
MGGICAGRGAAPAGGENGGEGGCPGWGHINPSRSVLPPPPEIGAFLKNAWATEPVITVSFAIGILAAVAPLLSPYTKYSGMINRATPYVYPVPVRDDGNMPDIPSHPCDKEGPNLEWLKKL